jgi:hypothetical protein
MSRFIQALYVPSVLALGGMGVVVNVRLVLVLPLLVLMWRVRVFRRGVIVIVGMNRCQVLDLSSRSTLRVVRHVDMLVVVHLSFMRMSLEFLCHGNLLFARPAVPRWRQSTWMKLLQPVASS